MSRVSQWKFFAFMDKESGRRDEHRELAEWQIEDVIRWAVHRGYDNILLSRSSETVEFRELRLGSSDLRS